jgi:hypothetical protein
VSLRVIVAGATAWSNADAIRRELSQLPRAATIIHGDSPGADALAGVVAAELGLAVEAMAKCEADYARYRRGAWKGLNERMIGNGAVLVLAFHPNVDASRGTKHLVGLARAAKLEVKVFVE